MPVLTTLPFSVELSRWQNIDTVDEITSASSFIDTGALSDDM